MAAADRRLIRRVLLAGALLSPTAASFAQPAADDASFTGVLKRVHDRGVVVIGYQEADPPFSTTRDGHPVGYTIDLCLAVIGELQRTVGRQLRVEYRPVGADARLDAVGRGRIDLECSSTVANADRHRVAAFSPIIFVAGTQLLVRRRSKVHSYRDLSGMSVVVVGGSTDEQVIRYVMGRDVTSVRILVARDLDQAFAIVREGRADAMASDNVLLYRLLAHDNAADAVRVVGGFLSYQRYGIMFAKDDPPLADAVGRAFARMAHDGDLVANYDRWFQHNAADGSAIHLPMTPQLSVMFRLLGSQE